MKTAQLNKAYNPYNLVPSRTIATDFSKRRIYADFREKQLLGLPRSFWFLTTLPLSYIVSQIFLVVTK